MRLNREATLSRPRSRRQAAREIPLTLLAALACAVRSEAWVTATGQSGCASDVLAQDLDAGSPGPRLWTPDGPPVLEGPFSLQVIDGPALAAGVLLYSPSESPLYLSLFASTLFPGDPLRLLAFGLDEQGESPLLFAVDSISPASFACGAEVFAQAGVIDPSALGGAALSNGLRLRIGAPFGPTFPEMHVPIDGVPSAMALEDLDGDGEVDLAVTNVTTYAVAVFLGTGHGGFGTATPYGPVKTTAIAAGDLDGDGVQDLATTGGSVVTVLLGIGDSLFSAPAEYSSTSGLDAAQDLALADVDLDGVLDVAVANYNNDEV